MKTTFDVMDIIWQKLNQAIASQISGKIYKLKRPLNSKLEDVIINTLPLSSDQMQQCVVNVNGYVPNKTVKIDGVTNEVPDTIRLKAITELISTHLKEIISDTYYFFISGQQTIHDESNNEYYINIRVDFSFTEFNS